MSEKLKYFWVGWWGGFYKDEACISVNFNIYWNGKQRKRQSNDNRNELLMYALVPAKSEDDAWNMVKRHFPGCEFSSCSQRSKDFESFHKYQVLQRMS